MRVALDLSSLDHEQLSGIGVYVGQLSRTLAARSDLEICGVWNPARFLKRKWISHHAQGLQTQPWLPRVSEGAFDLYHGPDFRLPSLGRIKRVVTIHDLAFYQPGMTSPEFAKKAQEKVDHALRRVKPDCVIAVSDFTRLEVLARFPEYEGRVFTVHHGADHLQSRAVLPEPAQPGSPYFLYVGNLETRKNIIGLLNAFDRFQARSPGHREVRLVLAGSPGFGFEAIEKGLQALKSRDRVELLGYRSKQELIRLYRGARGFLYPSLYEGFGFPILEAMSLGVPVLTSSRTATAEIAGLGAAVLVEPTSVEEISAGIQAIWEGEVLRREAICKGRERVASFLWTETARRTALVYRAALTIG
jgi:glycosyltransferase involved in cell wall biosynthesis